MNEWWTNQTQAADRAYGAHDSSRVVEILEQMHDATTPDKRDQKFGLREARVILLESILHAKTGDLARSREVYNGVIRTLAGG